MRVKASVSAPPQIGSSFEERFGTPEATLIFCWLRGLEIRREEVTARLEGRLTEEGLSSRADAGELPVLPWKGGVAKALKERAAKIGAIQYLAMWQGLRGEDLDIDLGAPIALTCSRFGVTVSFTMDSAELGGVE